MKLLVAAAAAFTLLGCNSGQPRIYRVAVDETQLNSLPADCYVNNNVPGSTAGSTLETDTNIRHEYEWVVWDGVDGKQYLDLGSGPSWEMGHAKPISINNDLVEGSNGTFSWNKTAVVHADNGYSSTTNLSAVWTFQDMGATAKGTLALKSAYACTSCGDEQNTPGHRTCGPISLPFAGRRIDTQRMSVNE